MEARERLLDALFFAASFQGPRHFVPVGELVRETGLPLEALTACAQTLLSEGLVRSDAGGALQITRGGIAELREVGADKGGRGDDTRSSSP